VDRLARGHEARAVTLDLLYAMAASAWLRGSGHAVIVLNELSDRGYRWPGAWLAEQNGWPLERRSDMGHPVLVAVRAEP
jgi:hypothetical protein